MKKNTSSLLLALSIVIIPFALSAKKDDTITGADHQLPVYQVQDLSVLPEPVYNPIPSANSHLVGTSMEFQIRVTAKGRVNGVRLNKHSSKSTPNEMALDYARQVRDNLSKWKFTPARDANNQPVAVTVGVPIKIVRKENNSSAIVASVSLILEKGNRS